MNSVERLFSEFTAADRADGEAPDPLRFMDQVSGVEREELALLIEGYLDRAPRRAFDAAAFAASPARALTDDLMQALHGAAGTWPALLPRLRHRARLSRADLVARLAEALGVPGRQDAVLGYYHAMEQGALPATGVTDRVLEALGAIVGESAAALRTAGETIAPREASGGTPSFARIAEPDPSLMAPAAPAADLVPPTRRSPGTADDVDALFTGRRSGS